MSFIKDFIDKIKSNPIAKRASMVLGIFFLVVIIIILIASCSNHRGRVYKYEELEAKMVELAKKRYSSEKNKANLPKNDKEMLEVSLQSFVEDGTFKDIQSIVQNNSICTGNVKIINNNGYYLYIPYLDCGTDYKSKTIYETLTNDDNIITSGNGLYSLDNNEYIYKGDTVNNYLYLNGITYRIIKINEDGSIRVLDTTKRNTNSKWDDRYNIDRNSSVGINDFVNNNVNSRLKDSLENLYNNDSIFNNGMRSYFVNMPLCTGKRSVNDDVLDSSIECLNQSVSHPFGLIYASEFYKASLDNNCSTNQLVSCANYNYLTSIKTTWTLTADKDTTYKAYKLSGEISLSNASNLLNFQVVTTLNSDLLVESGDGSIDSPYVIKSYETPINVKKR